jgi:hypothetical protein
MTVTALDTPGGCRSVRDRDRAHTGPRRGGYRAAALRAAPNRLICTPYGDSAFPRRDANIKRSDFLQNDGKGSAATADKVERT